MRGMVVAAAAARSAACLVIVIGHRTLPASSCAEF
jgi:hypothetical protein